MLSAVACVALSERMSWRSRQKPITVGVPDWLRGGLMEALLNLLDMEDCSGLVDAAEIELQVHIEKYRQDGERSIIEYVLNDERHGLELLDFVLSRVPHAIEIDETLPAADRSERPALSWKSAPLEAVLAAANHEWMVVPDVETGAHAMVRRVPAEMAETVMAAEGNAGHHLRESWTEAFGMEPNTNQACHEAIRAIEAALRPIVQPAHANANLKSIVSEMENNRAAFHLKLTPRALPGRSLPDPYQALCDACAGLWPGPTRHGNDSEPLEIVSVEEARAAAATAAWVVTLVRTGSFVRR